MSRDKPWLVKITQALTQYITLDDHFLLVVDYRILLDTKYGILYKPIFISVVNLPDLVEKTHLLSDAGCVGFSASPVTLTVDCGVFLLSDVYHKQSHFRIYSPSHTVPGARCRKF